jgi:hypothetical protein
MTKQQLREAIRKIIRQELNEAKNYPKAGEKGGVKVSNLKKGDILTATGDKIVSVSAGAKTPTGKMDVTVEDKNGNIKTKQWDKNTVVKVKNKTNEAETAPSKPSTTPGTKERPATPDKKEPRRRVGNPEIPKQSPSPAKAEVKKATMEEASKLKDIIQRFKSRK